MVPRSLSQKLVLLTLVCMLFSQTLARPPSEALRSARHVDGIFTNDYDNHLHKLSAMKFLNSVIGKRASNDFSEEITRVDRQADDMFVEMYRAFLFRKYRRKYKNRILAGNYKKPIPKRRG